MPNPAESGWTSAVGPLPTSVLPKVTDPILAAWLDLIHARQDVLAERLATIVRLLSDPSSDGLAASLIAELRREISEGLAKAALAGRQEAVLAPCSLCAANGGEGCGGRCRG